ncbi:MAG TPA: cyclic nucleotide-binding domain-containing protein [Marmoricola sp.]|jgi:trk system potassium uptake protein TrkA|nr:cyclic nucleotide-binding domain-containing protein [Marmoricola sp.]
MSLHHDARVDLLKRVPLFAHCSHKELAEISHLTDEVHLPAGRNLTWEGDFGHEFLVLVKGEAEVRQGERTLATLRDGDFFGEIALVTDEPRTATVVATTPVDVLVIGEREFRTLMRDSPDVRSSVEKALAERRS